MKKNLCLLVLIALTSLASAQPPTATKPSESSPLIPAIIVQKPGRYTFNNTEAGAAKSASAPANVPIVQEIPPEVLIYGKPVSQLTDEEKQKFLQSKIKRIRQHDLEVKLIRIAPGYLVTLVFPEPVKEYIMGDSKLILTETPPNSRELILRALAQPPGDTSLQVVMKSGKRFIYHIFISENFVDADLVICVNKESAWVCWLKWIIVISILAGFGYIFREKIKNFKLVQTITQKLRK